MFLGSYRHAVDGKGRVAIPAQFRKTLPPGSVISVGMERRLVIHPPEEWQQVVERYRLTPDTADQERRFIRHLFANAREVELDQQGRLLLDPEHRRWAQLGERAFFTGMGNVIEVIGEQVWDTESAGLDPDAFTRLHDAINSGPAPQVPA